MLDYLPDRIADDGFADMDMNLRQILAVTVFFETFFFIHFLRILNQSLGVFVTALVQVRLPTQTLSWLISFVVINKPNVFALFTTYAC